MTITIPSTAMADGWLAFVRETFTVSGATMKLYDGDIGDTTNLLASITLPDPAFLAPAAGVMFKTGSWTGTGTAAAGEGTIATWALLDDDDGRRVAIPGSMFGSPLVIEDGDVEITALRVWVAGLAPGSGWPQLVNIASASGAEAIYSSIHPDISLRADDDDNFVISIPDGLGNYDPAFQNTAAEQPQLIPQGWADTHDVMRFDGSDDWLTLPTDLMSLFRNVGGGTQLFVVKPNVLLNNEHYGGFSSNVAGSNRFVVRLAPSVGSTGVLAMGVRRLDADTQVTLSTAAGTVNTETMHVLAGAVDWENGDGRIYVDGELEANSTSFTTEGLTSDTDSAVGSINGRPSVADSRTAADYIAAIYYQRALSTAEAASITAAIQGALGL